MLIKVKCDYRMSAVIPPNEYTYWTARLKSLPLDRKANNECITLPAYYFGSTKSRIAIALG